jgi:hypothetical protein
MSGMAPLPQIDPLTGFTPAKQAIWGVNAFAKLYQQLVGAAFAASFFDFPHTRSSASAAPPTLAS